MDKVFKEQGGNVIIEYLFYIKYNPIVKGARHRAVRIPLVKESIELRTKHSHISFDNPDYDFKKKKRVGLIARRRIEEIFFRKGIENHGN
ncbi:MAG: hypothetical protein C0410_03955 [Anaerolinea sp.]|nr:hypothetical protein [Anaerolinea sp.]